MADPYPNVDEFGAGACTCGGTMTGCAVCATADILLRWGKPIPRLSDGTPNMRELGRRMGARHRAVDPQNRHGLSLLGDCTNANWCAYCGYLELKANNVPVAYGNLSWTQIEAHLNKAHAVLLPGRYGAFPYVSSKSYSSAIPAKGRSDSGFVGAHMVTVWGVATRTSTGVPSWYYVSDADFGSPSRPVVPPHSVISRSALRAYWGAYQWGVCYTLLPPPTAMAVPGLPFGALKLSPTRFKAKVNCNERSSPYVRSTNINSLTKAGATIRITRYTRAGTNVGGSATWYGTDDGDEWYHSSVAAKVGPATGTEAVR